ncbi:MAG: bifunctional methylenetetrahydrofolate dehydrogenase/methenyltetrahydrofolate cyclohydrolase FolD [Syntrophales bacterium]|nr:bifunctional methylenetetrahydrofolate dehydrogenase/methenyltetrahydrofolate cyclohydrolase FolD [Syntrophales bacterium]
MAVIIDGNRIAQEVRARIKEEALALKEKYGVTPGLAVVLVGEDPASQIYVRRKEKACAEAGFFSREFKLAAETTEAALLGIIDELNRDPAIHGILVQLPLPAHIRTNAILNRIDPRKDVDGFHPVNVGRLFTGDSFHMACTPKGIIKLLDYMGIEPAGKEAVIVGRSNIVGKPLALMLLNRHATITVCHTKTRDLKMVTRRANILVAAAGRAEMISADMVSDGAVVIDVGINRRENGKLVGDVHYESVSTVASYITPVPGGVGPMTIAMLLENTLNAARLSV